MRNLAGCWGGGRRQGIRRGDERIVGEMLMVNSVRVRGRNRYVQGKRSAGRWEEGGSGRERGIAGKGNCEGAREGELWGFRAAERWWGKLGMG